GVRARSCECLPAEQVVDHATLWASGVVAERVQGNLLATDPTCGHRRGAGLRQAAGRLLTVAVQPVEELGPAKVVAAQAAHEVIELVAIATPHGRERLA